MFKSVFLISMLVFSGFVLAWPKETLRTNCITVGGGEGPCESGGWAPAPATPANTPCLYDNALNRWWCPSAPDFPSALRSIVPTYLTKKQSRISVVCEGTRFTLPIRSRVLIDGNEYYLQKTQGLSGRQELETVFLLQVNRAAISKVCYRAE